MKKLSLPTDFTTFYEYALDTMVKDFSQVTPRPKSEIRRRIRAYALLEANRMLAEYKAQEAHKQRSGRA